MFEKTMFLPRALYSPQMQQMSAAHSEEEQVVGGVTPKITFQGVLRCHLAESQRKESKTSRGKKKYTGENPQADR